ncbi:MAG TPA: lysophospholipid acyltransferase family protein [Fibrobacteria bacterium]|jgi:1-acyl-sn-glycerol-3-phosphate acyltransferase|nr:lysophospholipid acyltransferase family protein [Fibrobacteria bacterium]
MITVWRVIRVLAFMAYALRDYAWASLFGRERRQATIDRLFVEWGHYLLGVFQVELHVTGREFLPVDRSLPRVYLCNHNSWLDIPAMTAGTAEGVGFVAKKELSRIPLLAFWMRAVGSVFIDRSDRQGARKALEVAARTLGSRPLIVFPEGTRSKTGHRLPLKLGGMRMAMMAGARIIPVHINNSRAAYEAYDPKAPVPLPVDLRFFPPMETKGLPDDKSSWNAMKAYVEQCWDEAERDIAARGK